MKMKVFVVLIIGAVLFAGCIEGQAKQSAAAKSKTPAVKNAAESITWVYNLDEGLKLATASKKPVMADFYAEWCGWCKKLDKDVYTKGEVQTLAKSFVCVKIDTDKNQAVASKYGVQGLPTIVFMKGDGSVITKVVGYQGASDFAKSMQAALKQ